MEFITFSVFEFIYKRHDFFLNIEEYMLTVESFKYTEKKEKTK